MHILRLGLMGVFLVVLAAGPAFGAIVTYNSVSTWNAAVTSPTTIDFSALPGGYFPTYTEGNVTFQPVGGGFLLAGQAAWYSACSGKCLATDGTHTMRATHAGGSGILAFGFNVFAPEVTPQTVSVRVFLAGNATATPDSTTVVTTDINNAPPVFFGLTSDLGILKVEIVGLGVAFPVIDNYAMATALAAGDPPPPDPEPTPEVPTLGYVGIGVIAVIFGKRKFR